MGLAAVSSLVTRNVPAPEATSTDFSEDIQSSTPLAVAPPEAAIEERLIPLPLGAGKATFPLEAVVARPIETRCGIERVLEWSKPGGEYCTVVLELSGRGAGVASLRATDQALYSMDPSKEGYRGSFFLSEGNYPTRDVTVPNSGTIQVVFVVDVPLGFRPATALIQESGVDQSSAQMPSPGADNSLN